MRKCTGPLLARFLDRWNTSWVPVVCRFVLGRFQASDAANTSHKNQHELRVLNINLSMWVEIRCNESWFGVSVCFPNLSGQAGTPLQAQIQRKCTEYRAGTFMYFWGYLLGLYFWEHDSADIHQMSIPYECSCCKGYESDDWKTLDVPMSTYMCPTGSVLLE